MRDELSDTATDKLYSFVLDEAVETLQREMPFFSVVLEENDPNTGLTSSANKAKLRYAPFSNLGCESEIAWLNSRLKQSE